MGTIPGARVVDHCVPQVEPVILAIEIAHRHLHASARFPLARHGNRHRFRQHLCWQSRGDLGRGRRGDRRSHGRGDLIDGEVHLIDVCGGNQFVGVAAAAGPNEEIGPGAFVGGRDKHLVLAALDGESAAIPDRHHRYRVG